jgi:DNA-binding transcriptional MerR regulator
MKLFRTGTVVKLTGVTERVVDDWCRSGHVTPVAGGQGQGDHRVFTLTQAVGIAVATELRYSDRGCATAYVRAIVEAFGRMTEEELLDKFKNGETHFVMVNGNKPILRGEQYDWIDVKAIYERVMEN